LSGMPLFPNLVIIFPKSTPSLRNISLPSNLLPLTWISLLSFSICLSIVSRCSLPLFLMYLVICLLFRCRHTPFLFCFVCRKWLITVPIFFLHCAHFFLHIPTVSGISVHFYGGMVVSLHFKLLYTVYRTNCSAPIFFILSACLSYFFTFFLCFISRTFSSFIMAHTKKSASTTSCIFLFFFNHVSLHGHCAVNHVL
jgi:hypothetical protein